jgi:hypothetical protein
VTDWPRIDVQKSLARIAADPTGAEPKRGTIDVGEFASRDSDIRSPTCEVQAILRRAFAAKPLIRLRRAIARQELYRALAVEHGSERMQNIEEARVDWNLSVSRDVAHHPFQALKRVGDVGAVSPIGAGEALFCVWGVDMEPPLSRLERGIEGPRGIGNQAAS